MRKTILGAVFAAALLLTALPSATPVQATETYNEKWTETGEMEWSSPPYHYHRSYVDRWNVHTTYFDDGTEQTVVHLVSRWTTTVYYYGNLWGVFEDKWQGQDITNEHVGNGMVLTSNWKNHEKATTYYKPIQMQWILIYANGEYRADHEFVKF